MATTSITIRMDEDLKKQAETLFDDLGMNMTTAFTMFAKAAVLQQKIPFELAVSHTPNSETRSAMEETDRISRDSNTKKYSNVKDLFEELRAECIE